MKIKKIISSIILLCVFTLLLSAPVVVFAQSNTVQIDNTQSLLSQLLSKENNQLKKKVSGTFFVILIAYIVTFTLIGFINKGVRDIKARHVLRKNIVYVTCLSIIVIIFFIWVQNLNSITLFLGVAGAGLALALQEVLLSIAGWILIIARHPFEVGDRIEIDGIKGDIIDIRLFQTALLEIGNWVDADQSTGRIVNIPNSFVFKKANFNYSRGFEFIWNEIKILVTFESDYKKARDIIITHGKKYAEGLEDQVKRKIDAMRNRYMIYYGKFTPIVYVNIKDSGVELTLRYLTEAKKRRATENELSEAILDSFEKEAKVNFAYPTYRIVKS